MQKFLTLVLLALSVQVTAQTLESRLQANTEFRADFDQAIYDENGVLSQSSSGIAMVKSPNKLRWESVSPWQQLMVVNGSTGWLYDPDFNQATYYSISQDFSANPATILANSYSDITRLFDVSQLTEDRFKFTPTVESQFVSIEIEFDGTRVAELSFIDVLGQRTRISFSNHVADPLADQLFEFTPPSDAEVIYSE
jgi:outer membrane lipoprotein carrier protein